MRNDGWYAMSSKGGANEVLIYDEIGMWGITAQDFAKELKALGGGDLSVRINSPGGAVSDGFTIYNALKRHKGKVTTYIDGLAASIASIIALAGDDVIMSENALYMIHNPWVVAMGDAEKMRKRADVLDKMQNQAVHIYANNSGLSEEEVRAAMAEETWYNAQEAFDVGFATKIDAESEEQAMAFDLSVFKNAPEFTAQASAKKPDVAAWVQDNASGSGAADSVDIQVPDDNFNNEVQMKEDVQAVAETVDTKAVAQAERQRVTAIMSKAKQFGLEDAFAQKLIDNETSVEQANAQILEALAARQEVEANIKTVVAVKSEKDERQEKIDAMTAALAHRVGIAKDDQLTDHAREFRSMNLMEMAKASLDSTRGLSRDDIATAALSTSDLPAVLSNVANKSLQAGYEAAPRTFTAWARESTATDFKLKHSLQIGREFELEKTQENGEYKHGTLAESQESYKLETYGKIISITRKTLVNDDLDALARVPGMLGEAASELENKLVYDLLNNNPKMSNGKQLFHGDHHNLGDAALTVDGLGMGRQALRTRKAVGGEQRVSIVPQTLLIPAALEMQADRITSAITANKTDDVNPFGPNGRTRLDVVVEGLLDEKSKLAWYLFGSMNRSPIEYSYLDGNRTPTITQQQSFDADVMKMKISHDIGVGAVDTTAYKSTGDK